MRIHPLGWIVASLLVATSVLAWTTEDHEIFDLVSALEAAEGPGVSFYSFLNVTPTATTADIAKSYRKRSLELHPDRGGSEDRFARLGTISGILRDAEKRKRYHHFYENGVPRWRGTGYYYSRYRPGLGTVLVFLVLISNVAQYVVQHLSRFSEVARIQRVQERAKEAAWGAVDNKPSNPNLKKKVRVPLGSDGGQTVNMLVEGSGRVYLMEEGGRGYLVDESAAQKPAFGRTWLPALLTNLYTKIANKPASISSIPQSTGLGDIDGTVTPIDSDYDSPAGSEANSPTGAGEGGERLMNRRERRAELKQSKKKKL